MPQIDCDTIPIRSIEESGEERVGGLPNGSLGEDAMRTSNYNSMSVILKPYDFLLRD